MTPVKVPEPTALPSPGRATASKPSPLVRELLELVAALDRRAPRVERAGEISIAREAAALKAKALRRVEELQRRPVRTPPR